MSIVATHHVSWRAAWLSTRQPGVELLQYQQMDYNLGRFSLRFPQWLGFRQQYVPTSFAPESVEPSAIVQYWRFFKCRLRESSYTGRPFCAAETFNSDHAILRTGEPVFLYSHSIIATTGRLVLYLAQVRTIHIERCTRSTSHTYAWRPYVDGEIVVGAGTAKNVAFSTRKCPFPLAYLTRAMRGAVQPFHAL